MTDSSAAGLPHAIGRYRILRKLGEGGMGIVYAARDERLDRPVAIKTLREALSDERARERFWQEARAAASVSHPNVCQLYEIGEEGGRPFIAMELLDGEPLSARIVRGPLPLAEAVQVTLAVLSALQALHLREVVHRDLKPSNAFLTPHGVKLLDFGLARRAAAAIAHSETGLTLQGTLLGTPHYMSPEQARGEPADARSDLFAVGIILFEMLTGRRPFAGDAVLAVLHAVLYEQPPVLMGSAAVAAVDRVIHRALAKQPADRYPSAEAMAQDLRAALLLADTGETPRARTVTRLVVVPFRLLRPDPDTEFLSFGLADAITMSLSGLESLAVRSSLVAARYAGEALDLKRIASDLEVDVVLTGTLLRAGEHVRVATQLVQVSDGQVLWSQTSQVLLVDLFQLQDDLAQRIVGSLPLSARDQARARPDVPATAKAYELYLRANQLSYEASSWAMARDLYQRCVEDDPTYAPAWARLGRQLRIIAKFGEGDPHEALARAEEAFRRALEINPDLSIAHHLHAQLEVDLGRAEAAMTRLLKRAQTRLSDAELFAGLTHACRYCGLLDASVAAHERARQLDPAVRTSVLHTYWMRGEYERVLEERYRSTDPIVGLALAALGRHADAIEALRIEEERFARHKMMRDFSAGLRAALEGRRDEALGAFIELLSDRFLDGEGRFYVARMVAYIGDLDAALMGFARAVAQGFFCFPVFVRDPWLDPLRTRPEFTAAMQRAEARHRAAAAAFVEAGGEKVLGVRA